jgi:hypothetical protein
MRNKRFVKINSGYDRSGNVIENECFQLVQDYKEDNKGGYISVKQDNKICRIRLSSVNDFEIVENIQSVLRIDSPHSINGNYELGNSVISKWYMDVMEGNHEI